MCTSWQSFSDFNYHPNQSRTYDKLTKEKRFSEPYSGDNKTNFETSQRGALSIIFLFET